MKVKTQKSKVKSQSEVLKLKQYRILAEPFLKEILFSKSWQVNS
jgi:hypothetical protein